MLRPAPPLASLYFFAPETEEEKKLRIDMGFGMITDVDTEEDLEASAARVETAHTQLQQRAVVAPEAPVLPAALAPIRSSMISRSDTIANNSRSVAAEINSVALVAELAAPRIEAGKANVEPVSSEVLPRDPLAGFAALVAPSIATAEASETPSEPVLQPLPAATAVSLSARPNPEDSDDEPLPELESDLSDFYAEGDDDADGNEDVDM